MLAFVLLCMAACANAAPQYRHHHGHRPPFQPRDDFGPGPGHRYFHDDVFDTSRFWTELSREMAMFDQILIDFAQRFPSSVTSEGIDPDTNEYKVTIPLAGFEQKDIAVKAREGLLMVQATQKQQDSVERNYLDMRTLPNYINVTGSWIYKDGVLKIVFPLLSKTDGTDETTTEIITESPDRFKTESREEIDDNRNDENADADVGINRGDLGKETELLTNLIPRQEPVEATTYAVDLKNEVEFVPVRY